MDGWTNDVSDREKWRVTERLPGYAVVREREAERGGSAPDFVVEGDFVATNLQKFL